MKTLIKLNILLNIETINNDWKSVESQMSGIFHGMGIAE